MDFRLGEKSEAVRLEARAIPGRGVDRRGARADGGDRGPPQLGLPSQAGRAGLAGPGLARGVRRSGSRSPGDPGLRRGAPAGRRPDLRRGHHPDDRRRHPAPRHRGAEAADPAARHWRGEIIIVLGFTEPESGSDVAAAQTRAVRDGDQWIINGQKMFTTNAQEADYAFMLTRTNTEVPKHQGLTTFLVPLKQPGVEIRAVRTISGERTNLTFYTDVRVDDGLRIGEVDGGWDTMGVGPDPRAGRGPGRAVLPAPGRHGALGRHCGRPDGRRAEPPRAEDPDRAGPPGTGGRRDRGEPPCWPAAAPGSRPPAGCPAWRGRWPSSSPPRRSPVRGATSWTCSAPTACGAQGDPTAVEGGAAEFALRFALGATTYGGTSEIQRNIIAQRGLGLPRAR